MADYQDSANSIIGSDYISGLISGFKDYVVIPVSSTQTVVLQGVFDKEVSTNGEIKFSGQRWVISRNTTGTSTYSSVYTEDVTCTVLIRYPYYSRGSLSDMSIIATRSSQVSADFAVISLAWGVLLCVVLSSLLRRCCSPFVTRL